MSIFDRFKTMLDGKLNVESRFELLREAISGTMSSFYMARDRKTGKIVGLKILDPAKTKHFESRFKGLNKPVEGEIGMKFDHPLVVKTLEHGLTNQGEQYVIMEFLDGPGVNGLIAERSPRLEGKRLTLVRQMGEALAYVHKSGFIHRDICPRNFICRKDLSSLKLIDFGLTVPATKEFMQPGNRTGTPSYMAPEVIRRRATDHRLDIFSLGVTCYQLCALQLPWPGQEISGMAAMSHDTKEPIDLLQVQPNLNPRLAETIMRSLAVNPDLRPQSADDFLRSIARLDSEYA
jgi:serine/threonine-protein kinase